MKHISRRKHSNQAVEISFSFHLFCFLFLFLFLLVFHPLFENTRRWTHLSDLVCVDLRSMSRISSKVMKLAHFRAVNNSLHGYQMYT